MDTQNLGDISFDITNMYREETFTDMKIGTIQRMTPVKTDGAVDESREPIFIIRTQLMSQAGPLPIQAPVEAKTLEEVVEKFPQALKEAVDNMIKEAEAAQREQASRIVVPGRDTGGTPDIKLV